MKYKNKSNVIALLWGFAEATFFFIVPDVYISYKAIKSIKIALIVSLFSLIGAIIGGTLMYFLSNNTSIDLLKYMTFIPGINDVYISQVNTDFSEHGVMALFYGPKQGIPYKLYALLAPVYNIPYITFIIISVFARSLRFILVAVIVSALSKILSKWISDKTKIVLLIVFWVIFYAIYYFTIYF